MEGSRKCLRLPELFFVCALSMAVSCAPVGERIDRASGVPDVPADMATGVGLSAAGPPEGTPPPGPLKISVADAVLLCLENNRSLVVQRLNPAIRQTAEDRERAVFDPAAAAEVSFGGLKGERLARSGSETEDFTTDTGEGVISLEQYFPTGTRVSLAAGTEMNDSSLYDDRFYSTRLGMTVTQALLRGYGTDANLARLRQARLDTRMSEYELRGFTEFLVAEVEGTYWDYALARRQIEIVEESLKVARRQLAETETLIAVGRLARAELAAVQAEVAAQEQALIEAQAGRDAIRLQLLRLINPRGGGLWGREVELVYQPTLPDVKLEDVAAHVAVSMRMLPVLNQARLEILRGDLALVETRNGLLPLMDLFVTLGKSGYANSFGESIRHVGDGGHDALAGLSLNYPIFNRDARALHRRALLAREQAERSLENLSQLAEVDVRTAYIEVDRTRRQMGASSVTRRFDEEKLRTEIEKLRVGKSTSFLVAQAQRDVLASRIAEVRVLVNYLKALIDLYRRDGSLLVRRGISAPGNAPVAWPER